jgi:cell division protein FtsW
MIHSKAVSPKIRKYRIFSDAFLISRVIPVVAATVMIFVAGLNWRYLMAVAGIGSIGFVGAVFSKAYRLSRITHFLDPWSDPFDSGFQLTQSLIAIGRGEWLGVGLGNGVQKLFYLPEAHTDFVFAVFAEEFGLLGSLIIIALFLALLWRIFKLAIRAVNVERFFEAYIAVGLGTWLGLQAFINIGVNMGLLPTKGLTLPLISYGRSSLIVTMVCIGILMRVHHELAVDAKPVNRKRGARQ